MIRTFLFLAVGVVALVVLIWGYQYFQAPQDQSEVGISAGEASTAVVGPAATFNFTSDPVGAMPSTFEPMRTGQGEIGQWEVVEDATAEGGKVLAQLSADPTGNRFPLAAEQTYSAADVLASVRFKPISGRIDQAGGVVVRLVDADNYYVARANALEGNVGFYRVVDGQRQQLDGAPVQLSTGEWHTLAIRAEGDRFTVLFDGAKVLSTTDGTFSAAGRIGFWTKADSVTYFERLDASRLQ